MEATQQTSHISSGGNPPLKPPPAPNRRLEGRLPCPLGPVPRPFGPEAASPKPKKPNAGVKKGLQRGEKPRLKKTHTHTKKKRGNTSPCRACSFFVFVLGCMVPWATRALKKTKNDILPYRTHNSSPLREKGGYQVIVPESGPYVLCMATDSVRPHVYPVSNANGSCAFRGSATKIPPKKMELDKGRGFERHMGVPLFGTPKSWLDSPWLDSPCAAESKGFETHTHTLAAPRKKAITFSGPRDTWFHQNSRRKLPKTPTSAGTCYQFFLSLST